MLNMFQQKISQESRHPGLSRWRGIHQTCILDRSRIKCLMTKLGFTLAEIMIVIGIIGIIAETTIPTLISNIQQTQYRVTLKKHYSELVNVMNLYNSEVDNSNAVFDYTVFWSYFKTIKTCVGPNNANTDVIAGECWSSEPYSYLGGNGALLIKKPPSSTPLFSSQTAANGSGAILSDGTSIFIIPISSGTNFTFYNVPGAGGSLTIAIGGGVNNLFLIDVNGGQSPNKLGIDTYIVYSVYNSSIRRRIVKFPTSATPSTSCDPSAMNSPSSLGLYCAYNAIMD